MEKIIGLEQYLKLGGNLQKLDLANTKTTYCDKFNTPDNFYKIVEIKETRITQQNTQLYQVTFDTGHFKEYSAMWIETKVNLVLDSKFL